MTLAIFPSAVFVCQQCHCWRGSVVGPLRISNCNVDCACYCWQRNSNSNGNGNGNGSRNIMLQPTVVDTHLLMSLWFGLATLCFFLAWLGLAWRFVAEQCCLCDFCVKIVIFIVLWLFITNCMFGLVAACIRNFDLFAQVFKLAIKFVLIKM